MHHRYFYALALFSLACSSTSIQGLREPESSNGGYTAAPVTASDYSANVDALALGYADGTFELRSPAPAHVLGRGRHTAAIMGVALSKDAQQLATVDSAGHVAISSIDDGSVATLADLELDRSSGAPSLGMGWDGAGKQLALASGSMVRVVDVEDCSATEKQLPSRVTALSFSPNGKQLLVAGSKLYYLSLPALDVQKQLSMPEGAGAVVTDMSFSRDGRSLGLVTPNGVAFLSSGADHFDFAPLPKLKPVGIRFADDGRVAVFGRSAVYAGAASPAKMDEASHDSNGKLTDVEFRRDGSLLVLGDGVSEELSALLEPPAASAE